MKLSSQFEYERLSRLIDECEDLEYLRTKCKELLQNHYVQRDLTFTLLYQKSQ